MKVVVVGGEIAGLAAARRLERVAPDASIALVEPDDVLGGKLRTEHVDGFVIEAAADGFLSRKERGVGLVQELDDELLARAQRWSNGMPQYVLVHPERVARIEERLAEHPGLTVAGAAYRGVGIPDCIASGERAAESVARALLAAHA